MLLALFAVGALAVSGCASNKSESERAGTFGRQMEALRLANFVGSVSLESGGSPAGLNIATNWSVGPQQLMMRAQGEVDFTKANASGLSPIPTEALAAFNRRITALEQE